MEKIDFVITWVDSSDPKWKAEKEKHVTRDQQARRDVAGQGRYEDNGLLRYWFRGVEQFAPWVNKVHFVTFGHMPAWLNTDNPKLNIVKHEDFLPEAYRPTFNSSTITMNLHRIPDLAEKFVFFNDDMFLVSACGEDVFFKKGLPTDMAVQDAIPATNTNIFWHMYFNNIVLLNKNYPKRAAIKAHFRKWFHPTYGKLILKNVFLTPISLFTGIYETHTPSGFLKAAFEREWEKNAALFDEASKHKFRTYSDITEWYIRYGQMARGEFSPINRAKIGRYCSMGTANIAEIISSGRYQYVCINDEVPGEAFERTIAAFNKILPQKSSFER